MKDKPGQAANFGMPSLRAPKKKNCQTLPRGKNLPFDSGNKPKTFRKKGSKGRGRIGSGGHIARCHVSFVTSHNMDISNFDKNTCALTELQ